LKQTVTDLTKTLNDYKEACKDIEKRKRDLDLYVATKAPMLEAAVQHKKAEIEQGCIAAIDAWLAEWNTYVDALEQQAKDAAASAEDAVKTAQEKQDAYDALKSSAADLKAKLTTLEALRKAIEDEDDKNHPCQMYFLMKELRKLLEEIRLRSPKELECDLYVAWNDLSAAKETVRQTKSASDAANELLALKKAARDKYVSERRDTILACIACVCPAPPTPPSKC
jgi:hypothetical protein